MTVYFICIFTLLYLFVLLLVVRLFFFSLFLFDSIVFPQTYRTIPKPTLKPWYKPNRKKVACYELYMTEFQTWNFWLHWLLCFF